MKKPQQWGFFIDINRGFDGNAYKKHDLQNINWMLTLFLQ